MSPTKTDDTVWVKNRQTGLTHGMRPQYAAYYLSQRDPVSGDTLYVEGSAPKAQKSSGSKPEDAAAMKAMGEAIRGVTTVTTAERGQRDPDIAAPGPRGHGIPDAARGEVATSVGEGPTLQKKASTKEPTSAEYQGDGGPDRQQEAEDAADSKGQEAAHADAKKAAAKAASKAQKK